MTLGQKLRFLRTAMGCSQRVIASVFNMDRSTYTYYELDKTLPAAPVLRGLAQLHGVTMEFLLDEEMMPFGGEEFLLLEETRRIKRKKRA